MKIVSIVNSVNIFLFTLTISLLYSLETSAQQVEIPQASRFTGSYYDKFFGGGPVLSFPVSNKDFIDSRSIKGLRFFYREIINDRVSAGFDLSYSAYNDYIPPQVYQSASSAIYTDIYNSLEQYTVTISGEYNFKPESRLMPYAGLGAGAGYTSVALYYNIYNDSERKWSGVVRPYAGATFRFSEKSEWAVFTTLSIDHSFVKLPDYDYNGFSALNLQFGLVFLDW